MPATGLTKSRDEDRVTDAKEPQYAIAGTYVEFIRWLRVDPWGRADVLFLDAPGRCDGRAPGVLFRIGSWESSPAREAAEKLDGARGPRVD